MVKHIFKTTLFALLNAMLLINSYAQSIEIKVKKMGVNINSTSEELYPILDIKNNILYFSRAFHPKNTGGEFSGTDIWAYDLNDTASAAKKSNLYNLNDRSNNFIVGVNAQEDILYLNQSKTAEKGFQFSKIKGKTWMKPTTIPIRNIPIEGYRGIYVSPDYEILILSMVSNEPTYQEDLFLSRKDKKGKWTSPKNLGSSINTLGKEISPYLSADKKKLFFASDGHPGHGNMDIFVSERLYDNWTVWSRPVNLGAKINSSEFEAYYTSYGDSLAYFSSNREGGLSDIFQVEITKKDLTKLRSDKITIKSDDYSIYSENAIEEMFGIPLMQELSFVENSDELEDSSKEFLYFIIENMKDNPEIGIMILADPEKDKLSSLRLVKSSMFFLKNGILSKRVTLIEQALKDNSEDKFLFYFYRLDK
ncbi:MAG: hypothetical protein ACI83B_000031 [Sediminicola sp.]|jgi:hypothetical protein